MRRTKKWALAVGLALGLATSFVSPGTANATDCFIGEVRLFAGNFAPRNWAKADGQLLAVQQYAALYSILGTSYGGDGRTTFALPDLRSRVPVGAGQGPGLSRRRVGDRGGEEEHELTIDEMPVHDHAMNVRGTKPSSSQRSKTPEDHILSHGGQKIYTDLPADAEMAPGAIAPEGGSLAHNNMPPYLGMNYIICLQGTYPSRN